jgi:translation elongation factor EF-4
MRSAGEVGFLIPYQERNADTGIGDTITDDVHSALEPLPGSESSDGVCRPVHGTRTAHIVARGTRKLPLNAMPRSSSSQSPPRSASIPCGFRPLHMEIIQERLEQNTISISSPPRPACYKITLTDGSVSR